MYKVGIIGDKDSVLGFKPSALKCFLAPERRSEKNSSSAGPG